MTFERARAQSIADLRALLIGCGNQGGGSLLPACITAGIRIVALVDQDVDRAQALAGQWNISRACGSLDQLGEPLDADVAIVALPPAEQGRHVAWALGKGMHVFVEKPPALDPGELGSLVARARLTGTTCCVGMNFRFSEGILALVQRIRSGHYGEARFVRVAHLARKPVEPLGSGSTFEASLFHAQGIHALDLAILLLPGAHRISGQFISVRRGRFCVLRGQEDSTGSGFDVSFGSCGAAFYHQLDVLCEGGDLLSLRDLSELTCHPNGGAPNLDEYPGARVLWRRSPVAAGYVSAGYTSELASFAVRVRRGRPGANWATAELEQLVPVYEAFGTLLEAEGMRWRT